MSCNEWKECSLSELIEIIGGGTPKTSIDEYWNGEINWISIKDFNGECKHILDTEKKITELGLQKSSTKLLKEKDIIISARGTVGELGVIKKPMAFNQSCYGLRANDNVNPDFLYYLLKNSINILKNNTHGSVFSTITKETFNHINVSIPKIKEQVKVANILSSLDDKIELNNEMNKTLEEMAHALFKRWFVDFEFPNENGEPYKSSGGEMVESDIGMIPKGWEVVKLEDICVTNGSNYSSKENWNYIHYLDTANITKNKIDTIQYLDCNIDKIPSRAKRKVNKNSIVYSTVRPNQLHYGIIKNPVDNMIVSTGFVTIDSKFDYINTDFIYYWLTQEQNTEKLQAIGETSTTAYPSIKPSDIKNMKLIISDKNTLQEMSEKLDEINKYIYKLKEEEKTLIEIRDTLLPKLMNGKIIAR